MLDWIQIYAAVFIVASGFSLLLTPLCRIIAKKTGFLDVPKCENHKLHKNRRKVVDKRENPCYYTTKLNRLR